MGKRLMHDILPPCLSDSELKRTVERDGERWNSGKSRVVNRVEIDPDTEVRLLRANCIRLVCEDEDKVRIYHSVDNTREYHETEEQFMEVDPEMAPAIEELISSYPKYRTAESLNVEGESLEDKMRLVQDLWERKILMTREPLEAHYDD